MKLEKTVAYLEGQLLRFGFFEDAYKSWLADKSGGIIDRYLSLSGQKLESLTQSKVDLFEALEEVNNLQVQLAE